MMCSAISFGIGQQFALEREVLGFVGATPPRSRDRAQRDFAALHAHHRFGRRADQRHIAEPQVKHVRRRIDRAQAAIEVERMHRQRRLEALRRHHLDNVAGDDVLLGRVNHRHVALAGLVGGDIQIAFAVGRRSGSRHGATAASRRRAIDLIDFRLRALVGDVGRGEFLDRHVGDNLERLAHVVEHQHGVGEHHVEVGDAEIVVHGVGNSRLETAHDIVGEKADRAAEKARQSGNFGSAQALHLVAQRLEAIVDGARFDRRVPGGSSRCDCRARARPARVRCRGKYSVPISRRRARFRAGTSSRRARPSEKPRPGFRDRRRFRGIPEPG